jgi:hypothetical protein
MYMLSFIQFITEKYVGGALYHNPTPIELEKLGELNHTQQTRLLKFGPKHIYAGGILTKDGLYAFNRSDTYHNAVKDDVPNLGAHWVPLYLYYFGATHTLVLQFSDFSATGPTRDAYVERFQYDSTLLLKRISSHPAFKSYTHIADFGTGEILR